MQKAEYRKAGLSYTIGSFFNKGVVFLTLPIFTRLLSTDDYGIVSTYNSWVSMVSISINMALHMAVRQAYIEFPEKIDGYLSTIVIFTTMVTGTALLFCIFIGYGSTNNSFLVVMCILQSYASALIEDYSVYLMMKYRYKMRTALMVLPNMLSVIIAVFTIKFVLIDRLYLGRIMPTAFVTMIFGTVVFIAVLRKSKSFDRGYLKYSLSFSVPLIAHGVALTILSQSDRTMITAFVGADKTGVYSVAYNFGMIATVLTTALDGIWQPWYLCRLKSHKDDDIAKTNAMIKVYVLFMTMVMCDIILVAPEILRFLAPKPYWEGVSIIPPIVLANLVTFIYTFYVSVEHYYKKTKLVAVNTLIAAVSNILLNYIFIPICGYEAAAYTTMVSYMISLLIHYNQAKRLEPRLAGAAIYIKEFVMVSAVSAVYYSALDQWIIRWCTAMVLVIIAIIYILKNYGYLLKK